MDVECRNRPRVGVVGTGSFAAALTNRLLRSGYDVTIGSRQPSLRTLLVDKCSCNFSITTISECISQSDIIILAIYAEDYKDALSPCASAISGKILIDVSNKLSKVKDTSHAEYLAALFPSSRVVKAFNTIPASEMKRSLSRDISRVFIAGNDLDSKSVVSALAVNMGFYPVDKGPLRSARFIENFNLRLFPEWRNPALLTVAVFNLWLVYVILMIFAEKRTESWNQLFLKVVNKPICLTSLTLMATAHLPRPLGVLARIVAGGKRQSPCWFKRWVNVRSQINALSWLLMILHVVISVLLTNKTYFPTLYEPLKTRDGCNVTRTDSNPCRVSDWMNWKGEAGLLLGLLSLASVCILSVASIPSVKNNLSWRERRFTQSTLSYATLFLAVSHVTMTAVADWSSNWLWPFYHSTSFLGIILPSLTLFVALIAAVPCIKHFSKSRSTGVNIYNVSNPCECPPDAETNSMLTRQTELTMFQERQRMSETVGYSPLIEEE